MALIKETQTPFGITANYYRIMSYFENYDRMVAEGIYGLYASKEARDSGGAPIQEFRFEIPLTEINTVDAREDVYKWLKANVLLEAENG